MQKQLNLKNLRTKTQLGYYLTGFADAEGSFNISFIRQKENALTPWKIRPIFNVRQNESEVLCYFPKILGCGRKPYTGSDNITTFSVIDRKDLREKVIPFFERFTFHSAKKQQDLLNFKEALKILEKPDELLTFFDVKQILSLRLNSEDIIKKRVYTDAEILALWQKSKAKAIEEIKKSSETTMLKSESARHTLNDKIESDLYSDIKAQQDLFCEIDFEEALNFFIAGFTDGDGSFNLSFRKNNIPSSIGWKISGSFSISQNEKTLLNKFKTALACGNVRKGSSKKNYYFEVNNQNDLRNKIIPFFRNFPILSKKNSIRFENLAETLKLLAKNFNLLSRSDLEKILKSNRSEPGKYKYSTEEILKRFDDFTKN